jgi:hypothetical protein
MSLDMFKRKIEKRVLEEERVKENKKCNKKGKIE